MARPPAFLFKAYVPCRALNIAVRGITVHVFTRPKKKKAEGGLLPKEGRGTMKTVCSGLDPLHCLPAPYAKAYADYLKPN